MGDALGETPPRANSEGRDSKDLGVCVAQAMHQYSELFVVGLDKHVALRAQVCRGGQLHHAGLPRRRQRIEAHGRNRLPKSLQQLLEVQQRDPDQTNQNSRQATAKPTDLFRVLPLREVDSGKMSPHADHTVVLKPRRPSSSLVHHRHARPPLRPGAPELRWVNKEVSRRGDHEVKGSACQSRVSLSFRIRHAAHTVRMKKTNMSFMHEAYVSAYHPRLPGPVWDWMRTFVLDRVREGVTDPRRITVERTLSALTGYLDWAKQAGLVTSPEQAQHRSLIDLYTSNRTATIRPLYAARERIVLLGMFEIHDAPAQFRGLNRQAEAPYSEPEIALIRAWASYQSTPRRTRNCAAIASFGLGCGLKAQEMLNVRGSHITELHDGEMGVVVHTGKERTVPALWIWSPWLREVRESTEDNEFAIAPGSINRDGRTMHNLRHEMRGEINPVPLRLRNTWLVSHLDARTPFDVIARASGAHYAGFASRLSAYVRPYSAAEELAFLRGPVVAAARTVSAHA